MVLRDRSEADFLNCCCCLLFMLVLFMIIMEAGISEPARINGTSGPAHG